MKVCPGKDRAVGGIARVGRAILGLLACLVSGLPVVVYAEAAPPPPAGYTISPEDVLGVSVWKEEGMDRQVMVRPDGGFSFPLAGDIQAAGKTTQQVEAEITERLARFIPDAVVTVSVLELKGLRIYVNGKVRTPGQYTVGRYVDVLQALTLAGGLTPFANDSDIKILRRQGGREQVFKFNYGQVKSGRNLEQNIVLQADDVVVVP